MSDDFEDVLRRFRREMLGPMVAHMDDGQVAAWLEQFGASEEEEEGFPPWLQKRFDEERTRLLQVLLSRAGKLYGPAEFEREPATPEMAAYWRSLRIMAHASRDILDTEHESR